MRLRSALAFGVVILVLKLLTPEIFAAMQKVAILAFRVLEYNLTLVGAVSGSL